MARKQPRRITSRRGSGKGKSGANTKTRSTKSIPQRGLAPKSARSRAIPIPLSHLSERSSAARTKSLHVKAAMVGDPTLSLSQAAKSQKVSVRSIHQYLPSGFEKVAGRWRAHKTDRFHEVMYVPDSRGNPIPVPTKSFRERKQVSAYLRDIGRLLRGKTSALAAWHGKSIAGVPLVTASRTLKSIEAQLSDFAIYSTFNGGAE